MQGSRKSKRGRIASLLMESWEAAHLEDGARIESVQELANRFQISHTTSDAVLSRLAKEGVIRRIPNRGSFFCGRERKKRIAILYDPDIYTKSDDMISLHRGVVDTAENILREEGEPYEKIAITTLSNADVQEALAEYPVLLLTQGTLEHCCSFLPVSHRRRIVLYQADRALRDYLDFCSIIASDYISGMLEFVRRRPLREYEEIWLFSSGLHSKDPQYFIGMLRSFFEEEGYPEEQIKEIALPVSNYTASYIAEQYFFSCLDKLHQKKTLIISFSSFFLSGILRALNGMNPCPDIISVGILLPEHEEYVRKGIFVRQTGKSLAPCIAFLSKGKKEIGEYAARLALRYARGEENKSYLVKIPVEYLEYKRGRTEDRQKTAVSGNTKKKSQVNLLK